MADVNQCETSMDRELYHTNKQKSNEQEWGEQAVHALSFTLERVNYLTTQRTALERSLAEEKRRNEHLQKRLDQMVETAKEIQTQRDRLIETNRMQYQQIVKGEALNKKLIAEKSKAKKRARR